MSKNREVAMENVSRFRAMGSICRQRAVFDPQNSWKHLGDAERWEYLAIAEISAHFMECNRAGSAGLVTAGTTPATGDGRQRSVAAA